VGRGGRGAHGPGQARARSAAAAHPVLPPRAHLRERIPDPGIAIKAFQKALSYNPDDDAALDRLAELAIATGEWKLALGACERLIKIEADPDRRVRHLHRVARVFADGLGDGAGPSARSTSPSTARPPTTRP
jgi:tetratricopeptide (TPR) repeat protein